MSRDLLWENDPTPESVSRLVNFSDAVVAIAVTLLVLPLVDIEPPTDGETMWNVLSENSGTLLAFGLSFVITLMYWRRHHRMFDGLVSFTPALLAMNGAWLLLVVFLQFPTEILGRSTAPGVATLYLLTLSLITWLGCALLIYLRRTPGLVEPGRLPRSDQAAWAAVTAAFMLVLAIFGLWAPSAALYGLLGLIPLGWIESYWVHRRPGDAPGHPVDPRT